MARKRTFQDLDPSSPLPNPYTLPSSSSPYVGRSSDVETGAHGFLSSPPTVYSSPMGRSASAQSTFCAFTQELVSPYSQKEQASPSKRRPEMKRRRTIADATSPTTPMKEPQSPINELDWSTRGNGKDGEDVWPADVEEAFHRALRLLPRLGRKKLIIDGKPCGRNELIGDYIHRHTGKIRSRKQVSSHIQVLKNMRKDDEEFMALVADPVEGDDKFAPGNARLFFGDRAMTSPYMATFLEHSLSSQNKAYPPPIDLSQTLPLPPLPLPHSVVASPGGRHSPFAVHSPHQLLTPTSTLTSALRDMTVLPQAPTSGPLACPFSPVEVYMHALANANSGRQGGHVFAKLDGRTGPTNRVFLEDLHEGPKRYPVLPSMVDHLPCQFLHVQLNLDIPTVAGAAGLASDLHSFVRLDAVQALPLTAVTTIFCHGDEIINFADPLAPPTLVDTPGQRASSPPSPPLSGQPLRHKYSYHVPFSSEYWTHLFRAGSTAQRPDFGLTDRDRDDFAQNIAMFSVVQEFVVVRDDQQASHGFGQGVSRGSALGDVVLVVCYDLAVCEGPKKGTAELSLLSTRQQRVQPRVPVAMPAFPQAFTASAAPSMMRSITSPPAIAVASPPSAMPPPPLPTSARPHGSPSKPNLSLHIPPPSQFVRRSSTGSAAQVAPSPGHRRPNGPLTPWGQVLHTPNAPPPVNAVPSSPAHRERLEQVWRRNATEWDLHSPALMGIPAQPNACPLPPTAAPAPSVPLRQTESTPACLVPSMDAFVAPTAFDDAVDYSFLPTSTALNALTASAVALPTPSFGTFPGGDLPGSPFVLQHSPQPVQDVFYAPPPDVSQTPDLVAMSASSSSTGSTSSTASVKTADAPAPVVPAVPADPIEKQKLEQDYFSSLLGSSTKYTGRY
ncbi:hypothetical protein JCM10213v2_001913 [Rhodosporidiobolus nylandii]